MGQTEIDTLINYCSETINACEEKKWEITLFQYNTLGEFSEQVAKNGTLEQKKQYGRLLVQARSETGMMEESKRNRYLALEAHFRRLCGFKREEDFMEEPVEDYSDTSTTNDSPKPF